MTLISDSMQMSLMTVGILASVIGILAMLFISRRDIADLLRKAGLDKRSLLAAFMIMLLFISVEVILVKPTQQLYFDDEIYQNMAQDLLHSGVAWWCNYGNGSRCLATQIFHEPAGEAFNLAIGFALLGINRDAAYATQLVVTAIGVLLVFFAALLLFRSKKAALLSELFMALSPIILVWAFPTTSDMPAMTYSVLAFIALLAFVKIKKLRVLALFLFSMAFAVYMKVDEMALVPILLLVLLILWDSGSKPRARSRRRKNKAVKNTLYAILAVALFVLIIIPELLFINYNSNDGYGYSGTSIQLTCSNNTTYMAANAMINLQNFQANICGNSLFWIDKYRSQDVIQPLIYTLFMAVGVVALIIRKMPKALAVLLVWLGAFFLFYTAFYAGGVTYGVDWRFMLALIPPASMLAGFGAASIYEIGSLAKTGRGKDSLRFALNAALLTLIIALIFYPLINNASLLAISPSNITQGAGARVYEDYIYNYTPNIPNSCVVMSYNTALFNLRGVASAGMNYMSFPGQFANITKNYTCTIIDYGYWCTVPGYNCGQYLKQYNTTEIANASYDGSRYSLYKIT